MLQHLVIVVLLLIHLLYFYLSIALSLPLPMPPIYPSLLLGAPVIPFTSTLKFTLFSPTSPFLTLLSILTTFPNLLVHSNSLASPTFLI